MATDPGRRGGGPFNCGIEGTTPMGNPQHFGLELPQRCLRLIDAMWPHVQQVTMPGEEDLGPLTSTFLLAMASPVINLPIERIERQIDKHGEGYASDLHLSARLATEVDQVLRKSRFNQAPFFKPKAWSFLKLEPEQAFNLAEGMPELVAVKLGEEAAFARAAIMQTSEWLSCLRNALAHGGIAFLNERGFHGHGEPVKMYAFASGMFEHRSDKKPKLIGMRVLRIQEVDFREFLTSWVEWLRYSGLARAIAA